MSRLRRRQRKQASLSSAGERISWTMTTTAGSTCWSSTVMSTRKWSEAGSAAQLRTTQTAVPQQPERHVHGIDVNRRLRSQRAVREPRFGNRRSRQRRRPRRRHQQPRRRADRSPQRWWQPPQLPRRGPRRPLRQSQAPSGPSSPSAQAISRSVQSGAPATAICRTVTCGSTSDSGRERRSTRSRSDGRTAPSSGSVMFLRTRS